MNSTLRNELICGRDAISTRLRCASCDMAICVRCLVRTPVGLKCDGCAQVGGAFAARTASARAATAAQIGGSTRRPRWSALLKTLTAAVPPATLR